MCGLAGFTGFSNNWELAERANIIQKHRGPDNQESWSDDFIALAHQRLSIIDLSEAGNQPFHKGDLVLVFNGEIYNYQALREVLVKEKQCQFNSSSDTEVILEMFQHYGSECLDFFEGMFVFAIYNKKKGDLFIARDPFGIKPLFYTQIGQAFAFSSELKTLVDVPGFNKTINPKALVSCLNYIWISGNETMFEGCFKLPPGHFLTYSKDQELSIKKYWDLEDFGQSYSKIEEKEKIREIEKEMESSVRRHMVADVPVSSFLSGGLDSSLISVLAKKINEKLSTYTIGTNTKDKKVESMPDDERYALKLAQKYKFDHHVIKISPSILKDLPFIVRTLDEPIGDPAAINTYLICKAARKKGVKVLLSGMGADEIFFGYRRQKASVYALIFNRLPYPIKSLINYVVQLMPVKIGAKGFKLGRWAKRFMDFAMLPPEEAYMRSYSYYDPDQLKMLLDKDYWPAIDQIRAEHKDIFNSKFKGDYVNQICHTDINMFMVGLNLTYTDRASMAASVEVRVPFIDKKIINTAMSIPGKQKYQKRESKYILKKAAEKFLPKEIIYRPKASFGAPIRSWVSKDLRALVDDLLSEKNIKKRGIFNYNYIRNLIEKDRKGLEDNAYQIYQLLTLELWFRAFIDTENIPFETSAQPSTQPH